MTKVSYTSIANDIFGNDAADFEDHDLFLSYAFVPSGVEAFADQSNVFQIVRAYKGEGKSALLRLLEHRLRDAQEDPLVIRVRASDLGAASDATEPDGWTKEWKRAFILKIGETLGQMIGHSFDDDAMALVELAQQSGLRKKNILLALFQRLNLQVAGNSVSVNATDVSGAAEKIKRWMSKRESVWLLIDDVDANYVDTPNWRSRVVGAFQAAAELTRDVPEFRIRMSVRPSVWSILKYKYESMTHFEQYAVDLNWSHSMMRTLLAHRIEAYRRRHNNTRMVPKAKDRAEKERMLVSQIFVSPMQWGGNQKDPHIVLGTMSRLRPRWLVELAKAAYLNARRRNSQQVALEDVEAVIPNLSKARIADLCSEFDSQCPKIEDLIGAFRGKPERLRTDQLFDIINKEVIPVTNIRITGEVGVPDAKAIAAFLYQIGFIAARRDVKEGGSERHEYDHVMFAQEPALLRTRTRLDDGRVWEIHPVFRDALSLRKLHEAGRR